MRHQSSLRLVTKHVVLLSMLLSVHAWGAQTTVTAGTEQIKEAVAEVVDAVTETPPSEQRSEEDQQAAVEQLREINDTLSEKISERRKLRKDIEKTSEDLKPPLEAALDNLNDEVALLEKTFEQIAIGGVDLSIFGEKESKFDWREEVVLIVQPLIENVKGLTEKPRKIESLRRSIETHEIEVSAADEALSSVAVLLEKADQKPLVDKLNGIRQSWLDKKEDLQRKIRLAEFQLASLEGKNTPWFEIAKESLSGFMTGRGLTLLLVVFASVLVWGLMTGVLWLFRKRSKESHDRSTKVHYRLAAYAYRALSAILIAIAIVTVLYLRQDLLLLVIVVIILFGLALAFKNLLPRYVAEGRLLLNVGGVRERERVMYNGIPWRVVSINMFCKFNNPQINGTLRVPIAELHNLVSRPTSAKDWFPSSDGDWVVDGDDKLMQVVRQGVELVELRDMNKISRFIPTADYYAAGFHNLTSGECFRVAVRFGIDYAHQRLDTVSVCEKFKQGLEENFSTAPFKDDVIKIYVEFDAAADSSLNYAMFALFETRAASHRNRIGRRIQAACVAVCSQQNWGIPFPQVTVHRPNDGEAEPQIEQQAEVEAAE